MTTTIPEPASVDRFKALQLLREPFAAENIAKLPKVNCWNCTQASKQNKGATCNDHRKAKCNDCGNYITTGHIHLDYVGHAEATDRLLDADPEWTWEPMALTADGLPLFDNLGGMWIRLTVAGVTRLGYGSANGKTGPDAIKEVIGDAIRNSGMRFGLALDLWARTDLHADEREEPEPDPQERPAQRRGGPAPADDEWMQPESQPDEPTPQQMARIHALLMQKRGLGRHRGDVHAALSVIVDRPIGSASQLTNADGLKVIAVLKAEPDQLPLNGRTVMQDLEMFIDNSDGPQQLHEAGLAIAEEFGKSRITEADRAALQERWKARNKQLNAPVGASA